MLYGGMGQESKTGSKTRERDRFAASRSHWPHMVVGTLNSSMVVGTLKFSIKCYMGAWAKRARQGARQGVRQGAT